MLGYIFQRPLSPAEALEEGRLRHQAEKLFGPVLCAFLKNHRFDFLHWLVDPEKASLHANFLDEYGVSQTMFLMAYLYSRDGHIASAVNTDEFEALEEAPDAYSRFIERNRKPLEIVYDYYAWLDRNLFGDRLPSWVCHKDALDSFCHEAVGEFFQGSGKLHDREGKSYYTNEAGVGDPNLPLSLVFWFFYAPGALLAGLHIMEYGEPISQWVSDYELVEEVRQIIELAFWSFESLGSLVVAIGGEILMRFPDRYTTPNSPYYDYEAVGQELELCKGQRVSYGWDESQALAQYYHGLTHRDLGLLRQILVHWGDCAPHWALFGGRWGYRWLAALMLLGLGWQCLRVLLAGEIQLRLRSLARGPRSLGRGRAASVRPGRGPRGRRSLRELPLLRPPWWRRWEEHFWGSWGLTLVARWSHSQLQGQSLSQGPALAYYKRPPQRLFFRHVYALKFYYALKEHARVGIVAHGKKGYSFRGPKTGEKKLRA